MLYTRCCNAVMLTSFTPPLPTTANTVSVQHDAKKSSTEGLAPFNTPEPTHHTRLSDFFSFSFSRQNVEESANAMRCVFGKSII